MAPTYCEIGSDSLPSHGTCGGAIILMDKSLTFSLALVDDRRDFQVGDLKINFKSFFVR